MAIAREMSYGTLRLGLYEPSKKLLGYPDSKNTPFFAKLSAGIIAGSIAATISNPCDL